MTNIFQRGSNHQPAILCDLFVSVYLSIYLSISRLYTCKVIVDNLYIIPISIYTHILSYVSIYTHIYLLYLFHGVVEGFLIVALSPGDLENCRGWMMWPTGKRCLVKKNGRKILSLSMFSGWEWWENLWKPRFYQGLSMFVIIYMIYMI